jgi:myo-inositol-1-phosphate synthase
MIRDIEPVFDVVKAKENAVPPKPKPEDPNQFKGVESSYLDCKGFLKPEYQKLQDKAIEKKKEEFTDNIEKRRKTRDEDTVLWNQAIEELKNLKEIEKRTGEMAMESQSRFEEILRSQDRAGKRAAQTFYEGCLVKHNAELNKLQAAHDKKLEKEADKIIKAAL